MAGDGVDRGWIVSRPLRRRPTTGFVQRPFTAALLLVGAALVGCSDQAFVPYTPTADLVPPLAGPESVHLGSWNRPSLYGGCEAAGFQELSVPGPHSSEWRGVTQLAGAPGESRSRLVYFATERIDGQSEFDERMERYATWFAEPCVDADDASIVRMKPTSIEGLPGGAISATWYDPDGDEPVSTIIGERETRTVMLVVWREDRWRDDAAPVPTDAFADVVSTAWTQFQTENR